MNCNFKTAHEIFEHALITSMSKGEHKSIYVKCPRCGKIGRLIVAKHLVLGTKYKIIHGARTYRGCNISPFTKGYDKIDKIYKRYKKMCRSRVSPELEQEMQEFRDYLLNVEGHTPKTVKLKTCIVKKILRDYGEFKNPEELKEFLKTHTAFARNTINNYIHAYKTYIRFQRFKREMQHRPQKLWPLTSSPP